MKRSTWSLSLMMFVALLLTGCSGLSKDDVMKNLVVENDRYGIHLFYKEPMPEAEATDLNVFHNSSPILIEAITSIQFWDQLQARNIKWANALEIEHFPMYVVIKHDEIVLQTQYLSLVKQYLSEVLLP